jgi:hypothetical protein
VLCGFLEIARETITKVQRDGERVNTWFTASGDARKTSFEFIYFVTY